MGDIDARLGQSRAEVDQLGDVHLYLQAGGSRTGRLGDGLTGAL